MNAIRLASFTTTRQDPFDRVLAAQALELKAPLVTRDPAIETSEGLDTVW